MFDLTGGEEHLFSDISFFQARGSVKYVTTLWPSTRLLSRLEGGGTLVDEVVELPASLRFFAGGDQSVRGYAYKSLGPEEQGEVIGGRYLLAGSVEWEYLFRPKWALALFADAGNAFDHGEYSLKRSVGVGIRWISPVGPVRLDVAHPINESDRNYRLHLSIGPDL
jgi:translocation and assembly module TamA